MTHCPICQHPVTSYYETESKQPFIHTVALIGLDIWGSLQVEKSIVCQNDQYVHFVFHYDNEHRLVKMGVEGSEAHYYQQEPEDDDDFFYDDDDDLDEPYDPLDADDDGDWIY